MARIESQAVAGYYPTPARVVPLIAGNLRFDDEGSFYALDPCAGTGEAFVEVSCSLSKRPNLYACELEKGRAKELRQAIGSRLGFGYADQALHGDAFYAYYPEPFVGLLYLNPPYDHDPKYGRLEQRFLERFADALVVGGQLVFIVPHYALRDSAEQLALEFEDLECFKFPEPEVEVYKQVVLFATRTHRRLVPDSKILRAVERWSMFGGLDRMPELDLRNEDDRRVVPYVRYQQGSRWSMRPLDLAGLLSKSQPWKFTAPAGRRLESVPQILPDAEVTSLMHRTFPVMTAPRPAHIAAGIASGLFNGREVRSAKGPPLLVKGVFEKERVTVDEKESDDGKAFSTTQVEQPKLVVVVLDLKSGQYAEIQPGARVEKGSVAGLTIEGLLENYGADLLREMNDQCPVMYDPARDAGIPLAPIARPLYEAQAHASRAMVMALGGPDATPEERRRRTAILLGEIGCGKTSCVLATAKTVARTVLVVSPPHLLKSWRNEVAAVVPEAMVRILESIADVDSFAAGPADGFRIAVMSREVAKLGHGLESVGRVCPSCGAAAPKVDHAKKRSFCEVQPLQFNDPIARLAGELAFKLAPFFPGDDEVRALIDSRHVRRMMRYWERTGYAPEWKGLDPEWLARAFFEVLAFRNEQIDEPDALPAALGLIFHSTEPDPEIVDLLCSGTDLPWQFRDLGTTLFFGLSEEQQAERKHSEVFSATWRNHERCSEYLVTERGLPSAAGALRLNEGRLTIDGHVPGSMQVARALLSKLAVIGSITLGPECGEPLYQATSSPRRYALARYIARFHRRLFDLLVLDEAHEYSTSGDSAQSHAAQRLGVLGIPTIDMTGSVMNGYARSLFVMFQLASENFRAEFKNSESQRFVDRYGYRKIVESEREKEGAGAVEFGSQSDRVVRTSRVAGDAPGVLPLFLFRHLLPHSITLHKADLRMNLPSCRQINKAVKPTHEQREAYDKILDKLRVQIEQDMFVEGKAGKLFGQLSELPSYLDRATADVGNSDDGRFVVSYPKKLGGDVVAVGQTFPERTLLPKEEWVLECLEQELDEKRNVMVFVRHVGLLPRLRKVIKKKFGFDPPVLDNVPTHKRQDWIDEYVVRTGARVLLSNPVKVQTGLNNLVHFATQIWHENPACNPIVFRQAIGRVDRIGQRFETRIYVPYYAGTLQEVMHTLLMRKVAVSIATDGLDPESVLAAAGGTEDAALAGLSLGRQLWAILQQQSAAA